ncbi:ATP-binding protein [Gordonia sp. ABSL1-1]|uniref:AlbA family DNA-binding domain-containing protein n=1 Tax=Gordonia sp. ABSL1-1 TaxID=3053923 RepID=UPI002572285E|nr:ATP-binding protein [Gordonia sp. ABSL1-1]MDL9936009.1 ATP-binding protein [Gordonia sp. ABSL1-1]
MNRVTDSAVPLWNTSGALVVILVLAAMFGGTARWLLRRRAHLNITTGIVLSILGSALGLFIAGAIDRHLRVWSPLTVAISLVSSILAVAAYGAVAAHFQRPVPVDIAALIAAGESADVEFKSTARINMRTGDKDPRMEQVIVKTVSAFLNADGGTLLVGVADDGELLGLDADYGTLKVPDADRFELWLRDLFTTALGQNAAAAIEVVVEELAAGDGNTRPVCRIGCSASPRPVYLRPGKNAAPEFWVRTGNSSRQLGVDQASEYVMHRWPLGVGSATAAQLKAAVRFSA